MPAADQSDWVKCLNAISAKVDMKKKKQKQRLKEMEKRSSEKGMDLMEAYTEKPVQEEVIRGFAVLLLMET